MHTLEDLTIKDLESLTLLFIDRSAQSRNGFHTHMGARTSQAHVVVRVVGFMTQRRRGKVRAFG